MTIKPCPYCASKAGAVLTRAAGLYWHHVECSNEECRATGPERGGEAEAIAAWNTRTLPLDGDVVERKCQLCGSPAVRAYDDDGE